jgi:hypothetical protein
LFVASRPPFFTPLAREKAGGSDVSKIRAATIARTSAGSCYSENAVHERMSSTIGRKNIVLLTQQKRE